MKLSPTILGVIALSTALAASPSAARADDAVDIVLLTNGGRLRGVVLVDDPKEGVTVRLPGGSTRKIARKDLKSVQYGDERGSPAPATAPAAPVPPAAPAPAVTVPPAAPVLHTVSFEGKEADVMLGPEHACTAPCEIKVPAGTYPLTIDGRPHHLVTVGGDPVTFVRLRGGSPGLLVTGLFLIAVGGGLIAGGATVTNNCAGQSSGSFCVSIPASLMATGVLWDVAGLTLTIVGGVLMGRTSVDTDAAPGAAGDPAEESAGAREDAPRVQSRATASRTIAKVRPWMTVVEGLRGEPGGVGGVTVTF